MTKEILDALLEWVKLHEHECEDETGVFVVDAFDLETKINELATADAPPVEQEDWRVGDKLISNTEDWLVTMKNAYFKGFDDSGTISNLILVEVHDDNENKYINTSMLEYWTNIDAELRAKDAEIERLKSENRGYFAVVRQANIDEKIMKSEIERLKNPWRTDLENAPRDGTRIDLIILCKGIAGASPERIADVMWNEKLNDWYIPDWEMTISDYNPNFGMQIKAWMPIPEPKGGDNG